MNLLKTSFHICLYYRFKSVTAKQRALWLGLTYIKSLLIGSYYRCQSVMTKQQAFWLVYLLRNKCSDWSVTGANQRRQSNKPSDLSVCYVTSVLIGLLQVPINDDKATSLLIGLSLETKKEHIVRAVVESLAFRFTLLYETLLNEIKSRLSFLVRCNLVVRYDMIWYCHHYHHHHSRCRVSNNRPVHQRDSVLTHLQFTCCWRCTWYAENRNA